MNTYLLCLVGVVFNRLGTPMVAHCAHPRFSVSQVRAVQSLVSHIVFLSFLSNILFDCLQ